MSAPRLSEFVKVNDVRGLVPEQLTPQVCAAIGAAFADVIALPDGSRSMVVGHDMRPSSPTLSRAFAEGLASRGVDVTLIGLCSTDEMYFASGWLDRPGAMFTASHNPAQYNGIKLCRSGARPVGSETGLPDVRDAAQSSLDAAEAAKPAGSAAAGSEAVGSEAAGSAVASTPGTIGTRDVLGDYGRYLRDRVDLSASRPLKVVVDAGNGMAGHTVPAVLDTGAGLPALPLEIVPLYFELDGTFPNHEANPLDPKNLVDLQRAVLEHRADIGLAFDGDADRCFVVDERGEPVNPSSISGLVASREIAKALSDSGREGTKPTVVHNAIVSAAVPEVIAEAGGVAVRSRVGHSFIKALMAEHDAVFGCEHSAHYYFRDFWFADTGMLAGLHVLAALGEQSGPLSELVSAFARYVASGEINSAVTDQAASTAKVRAWAQGRDVQLDELDGLTITHDRPDRHDTTHGEPFWWANVRPSNTEPLLRLNVEAADTATMEQVRDAVLAVLREPEADPV